MARRMLLHIPGILGGVMIRNLVFVLALVSFSATALADCEHSCEEEEPGPDVLVPGILHDVVVQDADSVEITRGGGLLGLGTITTVRKKDGTAVRVNRGLFGGIWGVGVSR